MPREKIHCVVNAILQCKIVHQLGVCVGVGSSQSWTELHFPTRNITAMCESAETFVGEHNFHAFTSQHGDLERKSWPGIQSTIPKNSTNSYGLTTPYETFIFLRGYIHSQRVGSLVMNLGTQHPNRIDYWICLGFALGPVEEDLLHITSRSV